MVKQVVLDLQLFGIEYRSLSNFWIKTDESLQWAWNTAMKAIDLVNSGKIEEVKKHGDRIVEAINTNNKRLASELLNEFSKIQEKILK